MTVNASCVQLESRVRHLAMSRIVDQYVNRAEGGFDLVEQLSWCLIQGQVAREVTGLPTNPFYGAHHLSRFGLAKRRVFVRMALTGVNVQVMNGDDRSLGGKRTGHGRAYAAICARYEGYFSFEASVKH